MLSEQYLFKETEKNVYVRKCYGLETLAGSMAQNCEGFTLVTFSIAATFASSPSRELLQSQVGKAWTLLRHQVPGIATKVFRFPAPDNHFAFRYTVPQSPVDADTWVKETVFFGEGGHKTLHEKHCELKDGRFWLPSDDHHATELHASPLRDGWHFRCGYSVYHVNILANTRP
ncbi:hypothetical protein PLICRDRAFT_105381 [Plicaturopsis crispa FD-325 SS-3]|nr:hypothetical protein PLICRDRAFT_105381 [Plicaturopsis crispa FD-325 SS-3]